MAINSNFRTLTLNNAEGVNSTTNYLSSSFENGTITGWSLFSTTLTSGQPTGSISAGAASLTLTTTSTNPLSEAFSLQLASAGAATAGQGFISDVFTLNRGDLAKPLFGKYAYEVISGSTNLNFSGVLGSQSIGVYFYDVNASAWIQPSGFLGMNQGAGPGSASPISFQSSNTSGQQYRMAIVFLQASAGAMTINFDDFQFSRQVLVNGAVSTDTVLYTPTITGFGATSSSTFESYRYGDRLIGNGKFTVGTTTGVTAAITLGFNGYNANVNIDSAKMTSGTICGSATVSNTGANSLYVLSTSGNTIQFGIANSGNAGSSPATDTALVANGSIFTFLFSVPIVGWSSNVQLSQDTDTRIVAARLSTSGTIASVTAGNIIVFPTTTFDTHGAYNASTGQYKCPVSGFYDAGIGGQGANASILYGVYKNGSLYARLGQSDTVVGDACGSTLVQAIAGDLLDFRPVSNATGTLLASVYGTFERLSGPSVIAASESVNAKYYANTSGTTTSSSPIIYGTKVFDSHNAFNSTTGVYTAPIIGKYEIILYTNNSSTVPNGDNITIYKNNSPFEVIGSTSLNVTPSTSVGFVELNAGEFIDIRAATSFAYFGTASRSGSPSMFSIVKVGD